MAAETKVIYYVDDEETPYMMKISLNPSEVKLSDLKEQLNRPFKKFFFKSIDDDIGVVKEEIVDDESVLPTAKGRVVCWVVSEGSASGSDVASKTDTESNKDKDDDMSIISGVSKSSRHSSTSKRRHHHHPHRRHRHSHGSRPVGSVSDYETTTEITNPTDIEATSCYDTEDTASRVSVETVSTITSLQQQQQQQARRKVYTKKRVPRSTSMSTMTTSTMSDASMDILTVTLNMDAYNFLGISIVGHANDDGVGGIYVGTVMKGGAVAADGRIETGDMLLQVNDINFENMSNDDAVRTLRELVQQPGPITLTVAKCLEPEAYAPMFEPRLEPIRPLDPTAWVMQTNAQRVEYSRPFTGSPTLSTMTSNSSPSLASSIPESERDLVKLTLSSPLYRVAKAMAQSDSGLEVKDRMWLKMTIPKSFIGSDVVDWLYNNVDGFIDRRHSRKYAAILLKQGFIRHTVNKITFSEQCYYVFGDFKRAINILPNGITDMHLSDNSGGETDTLGPLPGDMGQAWSSSEDQLTLPPYESNYYSHSHSHSRSPENRHTGSSGSSSSAANDNGNNYHHPPTHPPPPPHPQMVPPQPPRMGRMKHSSSLSSASEFTSVSQQHVLNDRLSLRSFHVGQQQMGGPNNASGSRASFQQAIDNPCEYFIDVM